MWVAPHALAAWTLPHSHCHAGGTPWLAARVLPYSYDRAGFVLLQWPCRLRPTSVSHVSVILHVSCMGTSQAYGCTWHSHADAVLHDGRLGTLQARGCMGFVLCMTMQILSCIVAAWVLCEHEDA
ncbi:hypothetical protein PanWU01x14_217720 [Parasponia andersonii]|uniref:Uncharacterized protein n=1 Tax=Parasponia andersonii TaxID=3476 RepID=A0A2P5BQX5_PARAD|nr:hypothetical protein PanWU01x14_217720 [Parasponia andersonii]